MARHYLRAISYYGSKSLMLYNILPYLSIRHKTYVEVFGGSALLLLNKPKSAFEVYNDIDSEVVNFFRVIRDQEKQDKLKQFINSCPASREEFFSFKEKIKTENKDYLRAAYFYYLSEISYIGERKAFGVGLSRQRRDKLLYKRMKSFSLIKERLKKVIIENTNFDSLISRFDSKDTLFYLDPPYVHSTRKASDNYFFEMNEEQHNKLIDMLLKIKGKVILSGYHSKLYDRLTNNGFIEKRFEVYKPSARTRAGEKAIEVLWLSKHFKVFEKRKNIFFKTEV